MPGYFQPRSVPGDIVQVAHSVHHFNCDQLVLDHYFIALLTQDVDVWIEYFMSNSVMDVERK